MAIAGNDAGACRWCKTPYGSGINAPSIYFQTDCASISTTEEILPSGSENESNILKIGGLVQPKECASSCDWISTDDVGKTRYFCSQLRMQKL